MSNEFSRLSSILTRCVQRSSMGHVVTFIREAETASKVFEPLLWRLLAIYMLLRHLSGEDEQRTDGEGIVCCSQLAVLEAN